MCGIVGTTGIHEEKVRAAVRALGHRGPDQSGVSAKDGVTLGHARLSIIDLSVRGRQPMEFRDGSLSVTYNGEIYNYKELKRELEENGVSFVSDSDTEVILAGYRREGKEFFDRLRGMWALVLHDRTHNTLVLSRDHYGIKPLYYGVQNGSFLFASEMRALDVMGIKKIPNSEYYFTFFNLGYFIDPHTCYKDIFRVQPGEVITYDLKTRSLQRTTLSYPVEIPATAPDEAILTDALHETLKKSVAAHFVSDVPVGLLFSGGNDSSLIAALAKELGKTPKTFHLSVEGSSDTGYAKKIGAHLGLDLTTIAMTNAELVEQYETVFEHLDEPFGDVSIIPTSLIYKKIGSVSKVVLSGEGGDELFGGYRRHRHMHRAHAFTHSSMLTNLFVSLTRGTSSLALWTLNPLLHRARNAYLNVHNDVIGAYLREGKVIDYPLHYGALRTFLIERYGTAPEQLKRHGNLFLDRSVYLPNDLLFKNDYASMMSSIEARTPLVDRDVFSLVAGQFPAALCLSKKYPNKYFLKKVLKRYLPDDLVHRDKRGFGFSFQTYKVPSFKNDVIQSLIFHQENADAFGVASYRNLFNPQHADLFINKYPRFAFSLVSNWKVFA